MAPYDCTEEPTGSRSENQNCVSYGQAIKHETLRVSSNVSLTDRYIKNLTSKSSYLLMIR